MSDTRQLIAAALPFEGLSSSTYEALAGAAETIDVPAGATIYAAGTASDDIYIIKSGVVHLEQSGCTTTIARPGEAFGWTILDHDDFGRYPSKIMNVIDSNSVERAASKKPASTFSHPARADGNLRRHRTVAAGATSLLRIKGATLLDLITSDSGLGRVSREDVAATIRAIPISEQRQVLQRRGTSLTFALFQTGQWFKSPQPYLMLLGYALLLSFWYISVEVLKLPRFAEMPGLTTVVQEWLSPNPAYGVSIHTPVYYLHILVSLRRIAIAFIFATALGVPVGLLLGWSKIFKDYVFPIFEMIRPIPILAWVPLAIIMLPGSELPVLYLTFLASFFATALNTMLGVKSIDPVYVLAAKCLGASRWQVFRHVVVPGALPFIFTGLQISIGVAWFSLVAAEMVSGQFGLGYLINTSYTTVQYPTIIIAMITLGIVGYITSVAVRAAGDWLMGWRIRQLGMQERR